MFFVSWFCEEEREASSISHLFITVEALLALLPVSAICLWILTLCLSRFSFGCLLVENDNCWAVSWGFPSDLPGILSRWMRLHLFSSVSSQLLCFTAVCVYAPSLPCLVLGMQKGGSVKEVQGWAKIILFSTLLNSARFQKNCCNYLYKFCFLAKGVLTFLESIH